MPSYWYWGMVINPLHYVFKALMVNHFGTDELKDKIWIDGKTVLQYYSFEGASGWHQLGYLTCFLTFFTGATTLILTYSKYSKR